MATAKGAFPQTPLIHRLVLLLIPYLVAGGGGELRRVVEVPGGPSSVVWVVQLSDLHLSAFHPERATDFRRHVGKALGMVNPALVLITGDLTDGKNQDLLTSKQEESEWIEYEKSIEDVVNRSGLNKEIFYDLRGNHDSYGIPEVGGTNDFYQKHSINARLGRTDNVQSVTLQNIGWKHLFVGFDSTMGIGLRSPTNVFGQPTDQLLVDIDTALSQWDDQPKTSPVTKIAFGHFPLSFSALTTSGNGLGDVFLKHSIAAYLCGHLHTNFGANLKRHHTSYPDLLSSRQYYQFDIHKANSSSVSSENCSTDAESVAEFWEWEMGDWRSARRMRILAIDSGHVSYTDIDFTLASMDVIVVPTFPLDSRFMQRLSSPHDFNCQAESTAYLETVRTLVFSKHRIASVSVKVYDSRPGNLHLVLDSEMKRLDGNAARESMYAVPWNWSAFLDGSPDRYWLQIEATAMTGETYYSELRPFSVNGLTAKVSWTWKEFLVMGLKWSELYYPIMWSILAFLLSLLLVPRTSLMFFASPKTSGGDSRGYLLRGFVSFPVELSKLTSVWSGMLLYLLYLVFFPWFSGHAVTEGSNKMHMYYKGWSTSNLATSTAESYIGVPDVMVIVLPHLCFVVLPAFLVIAAMAEERTRRQAHHLSWPAKKEDDHCNKNRRKDRKHVWMAHWARKCLLFLCLPIAWKHWKNCRGVVRAYDVNPLIDAPFYCFAVPTILCLSIYKTSVV